MDRIENHENESGIYKIENEINGKVYIGSGIIKDRFKHHKWLLKNNKHYNDHLQNTFNKYGGGNFSFEVLIYCTEDDLGFYEEKFIVNSYESYKQDKGYNCKKGRNSAKFTEEVKQKIRKNRDHLSGEDHGMYGTKHSKETREKIKKNLPDMSGEKAYWYGRNHDDETREKISNKIKQMHKNGDACNIGNLDIKQKGEANATNKLSKEEVVEIKKTLKNKPNKYRTEIAKEYNVTKSCIYNIEHERTWKHIEVDNDE